MNAHVVPPEGRAPARPLLKRDRRHPIHLAPIEAHNRSVIILVTAATAKRREILASPSAHQSIIKTWNAATTRLVGRYVIMPDHVHLFCSPNGLDTPSLDTWMRSWKSLVTRAIGEGAGSVWQRDHWDRQLRHGESYDDKWEYVRSNPVRHRLVKSTAEWPYQGELNELRW